MLHPYRAAIAAATLLTLSLPHPAQDEGPPTGKWVADGSEDPCTGPYNSLLNSPVYTLSQDGALTLIFSHRYSFEGDLWDARQVRISVNGGAFTNVAAEAFTANGYAPGNIIGTGIALGQRAFNGDSPGYADGTFITSQVLLGNFNANDRIVVQFLGAWDDCTTAQIPGWEIRNVKLEILVGAQRSTFTSQATASRRGQAVEVRYQWQRNDGAGWVDIPALHRAIAPRKAVGSQALIGLSGL